MALRTRYSSRSVTAVVLGLTGFIVGVIVLGIVLVLAGANRGNMIVDFVLDIGTWLTTPFHNLFLRRDPTENLLVNWGIAALVYAAIGGLIARVARW